MLVTLRRRYLGADVRPVVVREGVRAVLLSAGVEAVVGEHLAGGGAVSVIVGAERPESP